MGTLALGSRRVQNRFTNKHTNQYEVINVGLEGTALWVLYEHSSYLRRWKYTTKHTSPPLSAYPEELVCPSLTWEAYIKKMQWTQICFCLNSRNKMQENRSIATVGKIMSGAGRGLVWCQAKPRAVQSPLSVLHQCLHSSQIQRKQGVKDSGQ